MNEQTRIEKLASSRLVIFVPQFSHWHGARVMKAADYHCDAGDLPPERAVKDLGRKYLINPDRLRSFVTIRKHVFNTLAASGVRFLSGYAVPESEAAAVMERLDDFCARFDRAKEHFLAHYSENVERWADDNPSFSSEIRAGKLSLEEVSGRFTSGYSAIKLAPLPGKEAELERSVQGLIDPLLEEAARAAKDAYKSFIEGHQDCSWYLKKRLVRIVEKLQSLSFVNGNLEPLCTAMTGCVREIPDGPLQGADFCRATCALNVLASREAMQAVIEGRTDPERTARALIGAMRTREDERTGQQSLSLPEPSRVPAAGAANAFASAPRKPRGGSEPDLWF